MLNASSLVSISNPGSERPRRPFEFLMLKKMSRTLTRRRGAVPTHNAVSDFEQAILDAGKPQHYVLRLYVTGTTPRSVAAITNIRRLCEEHLKDHYDLEVIDIYQQPALAQGEQIIAAPTLIKKLPAPLRKVIGDLSNHDRVLLGLDLLPKSKIR
jgi:circadian clock protein KaiB